MRARTPHASLSSPTLPRAPRAPPITARRCHDGACGPWWTGGGAAGRAEAAQVARALAAAPLACQASCRAITHPQKRTRQGRRGGARAHHVRTFRHRTSPRGQREDAEPRCAHCFRTGERRAGQELHNENLKINVASSRSRSRVARSLAPRAAVGASSRANRRVACVLRKNVVYEYTCSEPIISPQAAPSSMPLLGCCTTSVPKPGIARSTQGVAGVPLQLS